MTLFIGLISGTSVDAVDAVLCDIQPDNQIQLLHSHNHPIPLALQQELLAFGKSQYRGDAIDQLGQLDHQVGLLFADAANSLIKQSGYQKSDIKAIGSHGQTVRHRPQQTYPFTLQIGDPSLLSSKTGVTTVADFRRRDMAHGGQGAPFAPAFHQAFFSHPTKTRAVVNLGGIANVTILEPGKDPVGFDTGPANTLMDQWIYHHKQQHYDTNGEWSEQGSVLPELLTVLSQDSYFQLAAPKSTGCEYFNMEWFNSRASSLNLSQFKPEDVQRTLLELTVTTVASAIDKYLVGGEAYICGGGAHNPVLMRELQQQLPKTSVRSSSELGISPDWVEAMTFAWFASKTLNKQPISLASITGSNLDSILGGVYLT